MITTKTKEIIQREVGLVCATAIATTQNPLALAEMRSLLYDRAVAAAQASRLLSERAALEWERYCELTDAESDLWPEEG